jgi:hypothetical protein
MYLGMYSVAIAALYAALVLARALVPRGRRQWQKLSAEQQARLLAAEKQRVRELWRRPP